MALILLFNLMKIIQYYIDIFSIVIEVFYYI